MKLSIEIISEGHDVNAIDLDVRKDSGSSLAMLGEGIIALFEAYDPIAIHIMRPYEGVVKKYAKQKA